MFLSGKSRNQLICGSPSQQTLSLKRQGHPVMGTMAELPPRALARVPGWKPAMTFETKAASLEFASIGPTITARGSQAACQTAAHGFLPSLEFMPRVPPAKLTSVNPGFPRRAADSATIPACSGGIFHRSAVCGEG